MNQDHKDKLELRRLAGIAMDASLDRLFIPVFMQEKDRRSLQDAVLDMLTTYAGLAFQQMVRPPPYF